MPSGVASSYLLPIGGVTGDERTDVVLVAMETVKHLKRFLPPELPAKPSVIPDDQSVYALRAKSLSQEAKGLDADISEAFGAWASNVYTAEEDAAKRLTGLCWVWSKVKGIEGDEPQQARREIAGFVLAHYRVNLEERGLPREYPRHMFKLTQRTEVLSIELRHGRRPKRSGAT